MSNGSIAAVPSSSEQGGGMVIESTQVRMMEIIGAPRLDRIKVITEDFEKGKGQITIVCYGRAWTSFWGGMGQHDISGFVASMDAEYVADNLLSGMQEGLKRYRKYEHAYVVRIVRAVQEALRRRARNEIHGVPMTEASPDWEAA